MNKKWIEIIINILFWGITSWLIVYSYSIVGHMVTIVDEEIIGDIDHSNQLKQFFLIGQPFFAIYFYLQYYFILKLTDRSKIVFLIIRSIILGILFLVLFNGVVIIFFKGYIHIIWFPSLWYGILIFYTTVAIGYGFVKAWFKVEQHRSQLEVLNKQAELNILRAQLHPHFLFNTMNNLLSMVDQKHNPKLATSIDKLSNLLRYVVYENKSNRVPVDDEINFIQNFAELHLLRFEDNEVDFKFDIEGLYSEQLLETGILLCFVENAFKHGVQPEFESFIHIKIDVTKKDSIIFNIENTIPPNIGKIHSGGYGLQSTKERLQLAYPNTHSLEILNKETFAVTLKIDTHASNNS